jgi:tartrate dehydratase beta subunit/fumarate hydratase class I family protein
MKEEKPQIPMEDEIIQKCIDPVTGRDITAEHISQRLTELEIIAVDIVNKAIGEYKKNPYRKHIIYEEYYWKIHQKLGVGSIGPATAAAGPLMYSKMDELANKLGISEEERIS